MNIFWKRQSLLAIFKLHLSPAHVDSQEHDILSEEQRTEAHYVLSLEEKKEQKQSS